MRRDEERRVAWVELISLLREVNSFVDAIIVEGRKDMEALKKLGLVKPILRGSLPMRTQSDLIEEIAKNFLKIVILTDFDEEGRELNRKLTGMLKQRGLKVAEHYRRAVGRLLGELRISTIESLSKLGERFSAS